MTAYSICFCGLTKDEANRINDLIDSQMNVVCGLIRKQEVMKA
jgi:hypothetical protein